MRKITKTCKSLGWALGVALLGVCPSVAVAAGVSAPSTAAHRKDVSITVYNQNFGLVREVRDVKLQPGISAFDFRDVAANIQPETVHIRSLSGPRALRVLEQNYRFDLMTPEKLLEKHVGQKIRVYRYNEKLGREEPFDAEVLAVNGRQPVLKMNGEVTFDFPGRLAFPRVPDNLIAKPTLVWLVDSKKPKQRVEVSYLTRNISWKADYVLVIDEKDVRGGLTGWVTLTNNSGTSYQNARLKLVAGDVQRVQRDRKYKRSAMMATNGGSGGGFREESFFEYHLYTLDRAADVLDKEQKQVTLLEADSIAIKKKLIFFGQQYWYRGRHGEIASNQKVGVYLDIRNSKKNGLGIPLPKGTVRVYKADKSGAKQFIGEDRIDHTPRDEKIRVKMGEAFDVVGDRTQKKWSKKGACTSESDWEIDLRNHKDRPERVEVFEPVGGDWKILRSTHPATRKNSSTFTFDVLVPARGKVQIRYRVRVKWC